MKKLDPKVPVLPDKGRLAAELALILRESYGERSSTIKRIAIDMEISERTVKNWYSGRNGPRGDHLIGLMRRNDKILMMVLTLSGRLSATSLDELDLAFGYLDQARDFLVKVRASHLEP